MRLLSHIFGRQYQQSPRSWSGWGHHLRIENHSFVGVPLKHLGLQVHCCPISKASCRKSHVRVVDNWLLCARTQGNIGMATEIALSLPKIDSTNVKLSKVKWTSIQVNNKNLFFGLEGSLCRVQCLNILNNQLAVLNFAFAVLTVFALFRIFRVFAVFALYLQYLLCVQCAAITLGITSVSGAFAASSDTNGRYLHTSLATAPGYFLLLSKSTEVHILIFSFIFFLLLLLPLPCTFFLFSSVTFLLSWVTLPLALYIHRFTFSSEQFAFHFDWKDTMMIGSVNLLGVGLCSKGRAVLLYDTLSWILK